VVSNVEFKKMIDDSIAVSKSAGLAPTDMEANYPNLDRLLAAREVTTSNQITKVRYHESVLRPGEGIGYFEPIRVQFMSPHKNMGFGIQSEAYEEIGGRIRAIKGVLDHSVMTYAAFADNLSPEIYRISVTILDPFDEDETPSVIQEYVRAHWFGREPPPGVYSMPVFPMNFLYAKQKRVKGLEVGEVLKMQQDVLVGTPKGNKVAVITCSSALHSEVGYAVLNLPFYDYYDLPPNVRSLDDAMAAVGAVRVLRSRRTVQRLLASKVLKLVDRTREFVTRVRKRIRREDTTS
jgi:hypothetical protein